MKKFGLLLLSLLLAAGVLSGCGQAQKPADEQKQEKAAEAFPVTIKDASGQEVKIEKEPKKIVSLKRNERPAFTGKRSERFV